MKKYETAEYRELQSQRMKRWLAEHPEHLEKLRVAVRRKRGPLSPQRKKQIGDFFRGKKLSPEHSARIAAALLGHKVSVETRKKIGAAHIGIRPSIEMRARMSAARRGRTHSEETKKKISAWNMGKKLSAACRAKLRTAHLGKQLSEETKRKLSLINASRVGPLSNNWKGGITPIHIALRNDDKVRAWRKQVFARDHYTCRNCGTVGGYLNAHHLLSFVRFTQFRTDLWNGRTLCRICHKKVHDDVRLASSGMERP